LSHPAERVPRRKSRRQRHSARRIATVPALLMFIGFAAWLVWAHYPSAQSSSSLSSLALRSGSTAANAGQNLVVRAGQPFSADAFGRPQRAVYPYSLVPGGVRTPQDLREASEHDRIVAAHYAGFNFGKARVVPVKRARLVYVSYRIGDKVFWTKKRMSLHVGELLITDGQITARTRCGNQISELPRPATSPAEPSVETLDQLIPEPAAPPVPFESALLHPPGWGGTTLPPPGGGLPPGLSSPPPIGGGGCTPGHPCYPSPTPTPPPVNMAEPGEPSLLGSVMLFWLGVAGIYWSRWKMKTR
jgi:hypothetical protein